MMQRFQNYKKAFMAALKFSRQTGAGVTDEQKAKGIFTVPQLLDSMCPQYERMKAIFGEKPNVKPFAVFDSAAVSRSFVFYTVYFMEFLYTF